MNLAQAHRGCRERVLAVLAVAADCAAAVGGGLAEVNHHRLVAVK